MRGLAAAIAGGRARGPLTATSLARLEAAAWPARPLAVRAASFARRVGSKPGQAPPPPTAAAARPSCALRRPPYRRCLVADVWFGASD